MNDSEPYVHILQANYSSAKPSCLLLVQSLSPKGLFIYYVISDGGGLPDLLQYDEESDHSNKAVRKTPEIESGHKVSEEVK